MPFVTIMDGVMCSVRSGYKKLRIENISISMFDLLRSHRVHVMDDNLIMDFITRQREVFSLVSSYNVITNISPLPRGIETLIHVSIMTERFKTYYASKFKIVESFFECGKLDQVRICSMPHRKLPEGCQNKRS